MGEVHEKKRKKKRVTGKREKSAAEEGSCKKVKELGRATVA